MGNFDLVVPAKSGSFLETFSWGCRTCILRTKIDVVPMTEEYLFIEKDFMNKCNKGTSFPYATALNSFQVPRIQKFTKICQQNGKYDDSTAEICLGV